MNDDRRERRGLANYRPNAYWGRLHERSDLSSVGQSGLSGSLNRVLYRNLEGNLRRFLRKHTVHPVRVFDAGAGTGYWIPTWRSLGASVVDGCDLVPAAVQRLNVGFGATGQFVVADLAELDVAGRYDLVSVMHVLLHVTDDERFAEAARRVAELVAPGGLLLLAEPIVVNGPGPIGIAGTSSRARSLDRYRRPIEAAGLDLVDLAPCTVLGSDPIEPGSLLSRASWLAIKAASRLRLVPLVGPFIRVVDPALLRLGFGSSGKFALFCRPAR